LWLVEDFLVKNAGKFPKKMTKLTKKHSPLLLIEDSLFLKCILWLDLKLGAKVM
jgi:hypothetical protein